MVSNIEDNLHRPYNEEALNNYVEGFFGDYVQMVAEGAGTKRSKVWRCKPDPGLKAPGFKSLT